MSGGDLGSSQCCPTSTAMTILAMIGEGAFEATTHVLLEDKGKTLPEKMDNHAEMLGFVSDSYGLAKGNAGSAMVLIELYTGAKCTNEGAWTPGYDNCQELLESIDQFPTVISTWLTSSGHVVSLVDVKSGGVVVNDPYGAKLGGGQGDYLQNKGNGEDLSFSGTGSLPPDHRFSLNSTLASADPTSEARSDWGSMNFFNWSEVEDWEIGKWIIKIDGEKAEVA